MQLFRADTPTTLYWPQLFGADLMGACLLSWRSDIRLHVGRPQMAPLRAFYLRSQPKDSKPKTEEEVLEPVCVNLINDSLVPSACTAPVIAGTCVWPQTTGLPGRC